MESRWRPKEELARERVTSLGYSRSEQSWNVYPKYLIGQILPAELDEIGSVDLANWSRVLQNAGFPPGIETQVIRATGWPPHKIIFPMAFRQLPFELAKVVLGDTRSVLEFVHKWGTLGFDRLIPCNQVASFDPLWFIWWHAKTIRDVLNLYTVLVDGDRETLNTVITEVTHPVEASHPGTFSTESHISGTRIMPTFLDIDEPPQEQALTLIQKIINGNTANIHPTMSVQTPDVFPFVDIESPLARLNVTFAFEALIEAIWWQLAEFLGAKQNIAKCRECGNHFERTHIRQEFCPPPEDHRLEVASAIRQRAQSLCGWKNRARRHRN